MVMIDGWVAIFAVWVGVIMMHPEGGSAVSSKGKLTHSSHVDFMSLDSEVTIVS